MHKLVSPVHKYLVSQVDKGDLLVDIDPDNEDIGSASRSL